MLMPSGGSYQGWTYDNWGANPSATPGTSVTPGASNAEGSWTQVASSANIAADVVGFHIQVLAGATATTIKDHLLDIGVDPAGGTSYTAVISNLICGESPALSSSSQREWYFPFGIKAGSSVAVRIQGAAATAGTVFVAVEFYGRPSRPELLPVGTFSETIGTISASSAGVAFTPGNAADGSWVSLGTTSKEMWWWQLGYGITNTVITNEYCYIEVAFGDVTNKQRLLRQMHVGSTSETVGCSMQTNLTSARAYCEVPGGSTIYIRGRCNNAPDTGYHAAVIGIGG